MPRSRPPGLFRLGKWLNRHGIRGGYRLLAALERAGVLDDSVLFRLSDSISIEVPIALCQWDDLDLLSYEAALMSTLRTWTGRFPTSATLIDGGADIGLFSLKALSLCDTIHRVLCFEPNARSFAYLKRNLDRLPFQAQAIQKALGDCEGRGELTQPAYDDSDHGRYVAPSPTGPVEVITIDSLGLSPVQNLIVKLDVEGGEMAALRGGAHTIQSAGNVCVALEAHPAVAQRTGIDPIQCLRLLNCWRPFQFVVCEAPEVQLSMDRVFFEQVAPEKVYNILGWSGAPAEVKA
jgi:FkbM family methyltransferase